jgi:hypothetical protein
MVTKVRWLREIVLMCVVFAVTSGVAHAQYIFWSDRATNSIYRADLDGNNRTRIYQEEYGPRGLAFDAPSRQLYWITDGSIFHTDIDGSKISVAAISDSSMSPEAIALDLSGRFEGVGPKIYIGRSSDFFQVNPDGSDLSQLIDFRNDGPSVHSLAIDFEQERFYWSSNNSDGDPDGIWTALSDGSIIETTDGTVVEPIILGHANGLALDAENDYIYWRGSLSFPDHTEVGIHRINLTDGSDVVLVDGLDPMGTGIALDPVFEHLYWTNLGGMWRSDLEGNDVQLIIPDAGDFASIVVVRVPEPSTLTLALVAIALAWVAGDRRTSRRMNPRHKPNNLATR